MRTRSRYSDLWQNKYYYYICLYQQRFFLKKIRRQIYFTATLSSSIFSEHNKIVTLMFGFFVPKRITHDIFNLNTSQHLLALGLHCCWENGKGQKSMRTRRMARLTLIVKLNRCCVTWDKGSESSCPRSPRRPAHPTPCANLPRYAHVYAIATATVQCTGYIPGVVQEISAFVL